MQPQTYQRIRNLLFFLVAAALLGRMGLHLISNNLNIAVEANGLYGLLAVSDGSPLYAAKDQTPFSLYIYTPLQAYLGGLPLRWLPPLSIYSKAIFARLLSLIAIATALFALWHFVLRRAKISVEIFLFALLLGFSKFADYATSSRNDMLCVMFEVLALCGFLTWIKNQDRVPLALFWGCAIAAFFTRQTGVVIFGAGMLWLLLHRKWNLLLLLGSTYLFAIVALMGWLQHASGGAFWEQAMVSNFRKGFRPFLLALRNPSMLTFYANYSLFFVLAFLGFRSSGEAFWKEANSFLKIALGVSLLFGLLFFFRPGGDVNYFFPFLVLCLPFAAVGLEKLQKSLSGRSLLILVSLQAGVIVSTVTYKTYLASKLAFLPYARVANYIQTHYPKYVFLSGNQALNMNLYLKDWAIFGPEVANSSMVAFHAGKPLSWVFDRLEKEVESHNISAIIIANDECEKGYRFSHHPSLSPILDPHFTFRIKLEDWLCIWEPTEKPSAIALERAKDIRTPVS